MEIRIYSQALRLQGIIENQTSLVWHRRYYDVGYFELHAPVTADNVRLLQRGNLIWKRGAVEAGVIEDLKLEETATLNQIVAKGRFLESYMNRRVIYPTFNFEGTVENAMYALYDSLTDAIPYVEKGTPQGFADTCTFQVTWKELLTCETKLAQSANLGFRFRPDFNAHKIYFEIYQGLDRTRSQHVNSFVEFSEKFDNLNSATYNVNDQLMKTVAYVAGEGEGSSRVVVTVGDTESTGYARRELYVDAKDLSSDDLTQAQYLDALRQRGYEKLNENLLSETLECVIMPLGNFNYKVDYDLGDVVTAKKNNWGIGQDLRITEIEEIYEHGAMQVAPTLGNPLPTTLNMED